jgi:hypothetical protein
MVRIEPYRLVVVRDGAVVVTLVRPLIAAIKIKRGKIIGLVFSGGYCLRAGSDCFGAGLVCACIPVVGESVCHRQRYYQIAA